MSVSAHVAVALAMVDGFQTADREARADHAERVSRIYVDDYTEPIEIQDDPAFGVAVTFPAWADAETGYNIGLDVATVMLNRGGS